MSCTILYSTKEKQKQNAKSHKNPAALEPLDSWGHRVPEAVHLEPLQDCNYVLQNCAQKTL